MGAARHGASARLLRRPHRRRADRARSTQWHSRSVRAGRARRLPVRPRRRRHEGLARRVRHGDRGVRRRASGRAAARSRCSSPPTRKARRIDGTVKVVERARARAASASTTASSASPRRSSALGDMIKNGRRGTLSGTLTVKRRAGPRRLSASRAQPDPSRRARARRARRDALGRRQRVLPADDVAVLEHPRRHRRDQRHPRHARAHVQLPLLDREHARVARRSASRPCCGGTASTTTLAWTGSGQAVPHAARAAGRRRDATRFATVDRHRARALVHRRHVRRPLHRRHLPRAGRARPGQRDDPQGRRARARSPTSSRCPRSTAASSSGCCA